jgi:DNA-binding CsgD family transcriptional regulator
VLSARGSPAEVSYAYAAVSDLLSGVDDAVMAALPAGQRMALDRARSGEEVGWGPPTDERAVATAFSSVIERISERSAVLLLVDDAQWLDASSRAVIGFTARRLTGRTGMLMTIRTGEPDAADGQSWLNFPRPETVARIRMRPLSLGSLHALIAGRLGHTLNRPTITRIHEISAGNPLFALELAVAAADDGFPTTVGLPDGLAALVRRRIGEAGDDAAKVLLAAACAAAPTVELLGLATDMSPARVAELLEAMETRGVVTIDGHRVRFTHPLFATGVYANATASDRRAMHRVLATIVEQPELKARHLALAATTGDAETLSALDAAVDAMVARGAPAVAAELIELALKLGGDTQQRRIRAGELHFRAGALVPARSYLQSVLEELPSGLMRALALVWLGAVKAYDDDLFGAVDAFSEAADDAADAPALRLMCLLRLALTLAITDRMGDALERGEQAVKLADELGVPGLRSQALSIWVLGKFIWGLGVDEEALRLALELEDPNGGATTHFQASGIEAVLSAYTGDLDRAETQMRAVQRTALDDGTEVNLIWTAHRLATIAVWAGRYGAADDAAREGVQRAEQMGGRLSMGTAWTNLAAVQAYTGMESEARATAAAALDTLREIGAIERAKEPQRILAFLDVSVGNYVAALDVLRPLLDAFDPVHNIEIEDGGHLPDAIEALTGLGRVDEAEPLVDAFEKNGVDRDRPWMLAMGARGRGLLLAAQGDLEGAQRAVEHALVHHDRLPMPFERARTQLLLGQIQRRRRHKTTAATTLRDALTVFEQIGAPLWAERARAELARLSGPADRPRSGLSPAEQRIAERAAAGLSNKEIAAEQFLALKTVEMTLSSVYRKLGIRSRAQLHPLLSSDDFQG